MRLWRREVFIAKDFGEERSRLSEKDDLDHPEISNHVWESRLALKDGLDSRDSVALTKRMCNLSYGRSELRVCAPNEKNLRKGDIFIDNEGEIPLPFKLVKVAERSFSYTDGSRKYKSTYANVDGIFIRINKRGIPCVVAVSNSYLEDL